MQRLIILLTTLLFYACSPTQKIDYTTFNYMKNGALKESDSLNHYNLNNKIYTSKRQFIFNYYAIDSLGNRLKCKLTKHHKTDSLSYVETVGAFGKWAEGDSMNINRVRLYVRENSGELVDYTEQTYIEYNYLNHYKKKSITKALTTVIEDNNRIFLHPTRTYCFNMLYYQAYPEVRFPIEIGQKFTGSRRTLKYVKPYLKAHGFRDIPEGYLRYRFTVEKKEMVQTPFKTLECYVIQTQDGGSYSRFREFNIY